MIQKRGAVLQHPCTAVAHPNIALVKYWGKRSGPGNVPATDSLSITLDTLKTTTRVCFDSALQQDNIQLNGAVPTAVGKQRLVDFLGLVRRLAGIQTYAHVYSHNNFLTAAGLASSASGFAALALSATTAAGLSLTTQELSVLARQGSGSAARSVLGGFVHMQAGCQADGNDAYAQQVLPPESWPLQVVVVVTSQSAKEVGSTEGMERTRLTSPYYAAWLQTAADDLQQAQTAVHQRDFAALAQVAQHSCLKMHAMAMAAQPGLLYWQPATLAVIRAVESLQQKNVPVFYTIDAGPQVKAVCLLEVLGDVLHRLKAVDGVQQTTCTALGPGAYIVETV